MYLYIYDDGDVFQSQYSPTDEQLGEIAEGRLRVFTQVCGGPVFVEIAPDVTFEDVQFFKSEIKLKEETNEKIEAIRNDPRKLGGFPRLYHPPVSPGLPEEDQDAAGGSTSGTEGSPQDEA